MKKITVNDNVHVGASKWYIYRRADYNFEVKQEKINWKKSSTNLRKKETEVSSWQQFSAWPCLFDLLVHGLVRFSQQAPLGSQAWAQYGLDMSCEPRKTFSLQRYIPTETLLFHSGWKCRNVLTAVTGSELASLAHEWFFGSELLGCALSFLTSLSSRCFFVGVSHFLKKESILFVLMEAPIKNQRWQCTTLQDGALFVNYLVPLVLSLLTSSQMSLIAKCEKTSLTFFYFS